MTVQRLVFAWIVVSCFAAAQAACSSPAVDLPAPPSGPAVGSAGAGGAGAGARPNAQGGDTRSSRAAPDAEERPGQGAAGRKPPANDEPADVCKPNERRCADGSAVETCENGERWRETKRCPSVCEEGRCTGECSPGALRCGSNNNTPEECDDHGEWQPQAACEFVCSGEGVCTGTCIPKSQRCTGNNLETCDAMGAYSESEACDFVCTDDACGGECVPGTRQCRGMDAQECDAQGRWQTSRTCPFVCTDGACTGVCMPGTRACGLANAPTMCNDQGNWMAGGASCTTTNETCVQGSCTGVCAPGQATCPVPGAIQSCGITGQWAPGRMCPVGQNMEQLVCYNDGPTGLNGRCLPQR